MKIKNKQNGFAVIEVFGILLVVFILAAIGWYVVKSRANQGQSSSRSTNTRVTSTQKLPDATGKPADSEKTVSEAIQNNKTDGKTAQATPPPAQTPPSSPPPAAPAASTNCLPPDPTPYETINLSKTNFQFMYSDSYAATKKFADALKFAGLSDDVEANNTTVFTMTDYVFDSLTPAQLAFMNASPTNMRSVLGWHVIRSCQTLKQTFDSLLNTGKTIKLNTLNGQVTFTGTDHGKVQNAEVAIYDAYTKNGAVHYITGYISPPSQ